MPKSKTKPLDPWAHQDEAVAAVVTGFKKHDRLRCIMACGTGKTIIGARIAKTMKADRILVLVPSLGLLSQTLRVWRARFKDMAILAVCGDATVGAKANDGQDEDDLTAAQVQEETGIRPTTQPDTIAHWLRANKHGVVFCTYQSSEVLQAAQNRRAVPAFDLAIMDEAHRCAGKLTGTFTTIVRPDAIKVSKRLFMTATPRVFRRGSKLEGNDATIDIASMDNEKLYGPRAYYLSFGDAVARGVLCEWQIVVSLVTDREVADYIKYRRSMKLGGQRFNARELATHIAVHKAVHEFGLTKTITFHSRIFKARDFSQRHQLAVQAVTGKTPKMWTNHISASFNSRDRLRILEEFARQPKDVAALLTNAQCLTEGVDVPAVDAIVFSDPRESVVAIVQAIGRALRKSPGKTIGTIVVPVFVKEADAQVDANGKVSDAVMARTNFRTVRKVLLALRANDERLGGLLSRIHADGHNNTGSGEGGQPVAPRYVPHDEVVKGIKEGTMVVATDVNQVHETRAGRVYDKKGREIVVKLPKNVRVTGRVMAMNEAFASAIRNRVVQEGTDPVDVQAMVIADFIDREGRTPNAAVPGESRLADMANAVRRAGRRQGYTDTTKEN